MSIYIVNTESEKQLIPIFEKSKLVIISLILFQQILTTKLIRITKNILKTIGALLNTQKRFCRYEKVSQHVESLKNTIKNSTKPLKDLPVYRGEEPSPTKSFFKFKAPEKSFVVKYEIFRASHETPIVSYFLTKPFSGALNLKKGFVGEGSSLRYTERSFNGFVEFFIVFFKLSTCLETFS